MARLLRKRLQSSRGAAEGVLYYPLYLAAVKGKTTTEGDRKELENKYKGALVRKKRAVQMKKEQQSKELPAYEAIVKSIVRFIKNKRGVAERTFEEAMTRKSV
jgi:hypothetical protein